MKALIGVTVEVQVCRHDAQANCQLCESFQFRPHRLGTGLLAAKALPAHSFMRRGEKNWSAGILVALSGRFS